MKEAQKRQANIFYWRFCASQRTSAFPTLPRPDLVPLQLFPIRNPDILNMRRFTQKLFTLTLHSIQPITRMPIVDPCALHIPRRSKFDTLGPLGRTEVPHRL